MKDVMEYKGFVGSVHYSAEDHVLHGKLEGIRDLVTYEGTDVETLKAAFQEAVDDYLSTCASAGRQPETPYKGSFNVRTGSELHKRLAILASQRGKKLNSVVVEALELYLATTEGNRDRERFRSDCDARKAYACMRDVVENMALISSHWIVQRPPQKYQIPPTGPSGRESDWQKDFANAALEQVGAC